MLKSYNQNIVSFYFKEELINLQVDNFVSGVELIETLLISLSLFIFILLAISIIDSMNERKRTCSLFKSFGMENKQCTFSLFIEMGVFVFSSILVFLVLTPFISQTFLMINTINLFSKIPYLYFTLIEIILSLLLALIPFLILVFTSKDIKNAIILTDLKNIT